MRIVTIVLAVLAVLVVAVLAAPLLIPRDWLVAKVSDLVREATGRPFAVDGDVSLSLIPTPRLVAEQIRVGEGDTPLLRLAKLEAVVGLAPLLSGRIDLERLILAEPVATLRVDANGQNNWSTRTNPPEQPSSSSPDPAAGASSLPDLALGDVRIEDGVVDYADARSGVAERVEAINLTVDAPALAGPAALKGNAQVRGERVDLDLRVAELGELIEKSASPGSVAIDGPISLSLDGLLSTSPSGKIRVEMPDVGKALQWAKVTVPAKAPLPRQLTLTGDLKVDGKVVSLGAAELASDLLQGTGTVQYDGSAARPKLAGAFNTGVVDIERLIPRRPDEPAPAAAPPAQAAQAAQPTGAPEPPAPSDTPLNLPTSLPVDLDVTLRVGGVTTSGLTLGPSQVRTTSGANYLLVQLLEVRAYNGTLTGQINSAADANKIPRLAVKLAASGVQVGPLLRDLTKEEESLDGRLALNVDVTGDGRSVNSLLGNMDGKADVRLLAATAKGFDLTRLSGDPAQIAAVLAREGWRGGSTRIDQASASFAIANGMAVSNDVTGQAPPLQVSGNGRINLGARRIDRIELVSKAMAGQEQSALGQLPTVPIVISGPFENLSVSVNTKGALEALAKDPKTVQRVIDQVNKLGGKDGKPLIPEDAGKLLEGLLGRQ
ncbi:MAG TPA: AsmA family protein [Geminicoccus sp.]|jgi:AsmA protein|uniref:AsmA family protein n=1 Tax=Geminicoccus sp. TaxID=2024832 RepID=UPI002E35FC1A|nr:AsmA family protein [Geminicoccus sp.]HEX2524964.1 AsmA family protein [Geminicoccus sp.]